MVRRLARNRLATLGSALVLLVTIAAILGPVVYGVDPNFQVLDQRLLPPLSDGHLLGTDAFGRDIVARLLVGGRVSLTAGALAVAAGALVGTALGVVAAYFGGAVDMVTGRVFDVILSFPAILLALAIVATLGPSLVNTVIAIAVTSIPRVGRVMRSAALTVRRREFIEASQAAGAGHAYALRRHVVPNVLAPLLVISTLGVATAILTEATLSFLGLGVPPPTATWGEMINNGKQYMATAPWISVSAGLVIVLAVLGFTLLGDGLRDLLDPRVQSATERVPST